MRRQEVLDRVDIPGFYGRHIEGFKATGKEEVVCRCPFHEDSTPSMTVNVTTGLFHCFGCGEGGRDPIQFLEKRHGLDYKEAIERLCKEEGIDLAVPKKKAPIVDKAPRYLTTKQVTALHKQLVDNEKVLAEFQGKYGLTREIIEHYLLGLQNGHYTIPIEVKPGQWTVKEHKGIQTKGAKMSLYPKDVLTGDSPRIVIAEGEFKALLFIQMGFSAVTQTAGASSWSRDFNSSFEDREVIIAYDADQAGKDGTAKVANNLKGIARAVKAIEWPGEMIGGDRKDVTDYVVKLGHTKAELQKLIDQARDIGPEVKEIYGIRYVQPEGFLIHRECIEYVFEERGGGIGKRLVAYSPLFITGRAVDVDTGGEELEMAFVRDGRLKKLWASRLQVFDAKKLTEFASVGAPVNTGNVKKVVEYMAAYEARNANLIPRTLVAKGVGWKDVDGKSMFILNNRFNSKEAKRQSNGDSEVSVEFIAEAGFERFVKAFVPQGTFKGWKEAIVPSLCFHDARFALYASLAAPLLRPLKAPNFIIDYNGETSLGKTTALETRSERVGQSLERGRRPRFRMGFDKGLHRADGQFLL